MSDKSFYVELIDGKPSLKKKHSNGYCSQIQMALGLSNISFCDFIVYSFKGCIIIRILFDEVYFKNLITKINNFYNTYLLPALVAADAEKNQAS